MYVFLIALFAASVLLAASVPGFLLRKFGVIPESCIAGFSKVLIYISQPCLAVYTFKATEYTPEKLADIGIFAALTLGVHALMLGGAYLVLRRRCDNPLYRILTVATTFANCAFFGIPIIEALFPAFAKDVIIYTTVYSVVMNVIGWTVGSAIISGDAKYISPKKIFLNPALIGTAVAFILFIFEIPLTFTVPGGSAEFTLISDVITVAAKMSTPISMLIMGMRLATMKWRSFFTDYRIYLTILVKQILMPLIAFAAVLFLPISPEMKCVFFVICACPAASVVLNYAEMVGAGQREAANTVVLSTMLSVVTLPLMALLLRFLA